MINKKYLKILRSKRNLILNNFIYDEIATRIIDSLDLLKVDFKNILEIGINENKIYNYLNNRFNNLKFTRNDISILNISNLKNCELIEEDLDNFKFEKEKYDLIYSNFYSHLSNNYTEFLYKISNSLKSNSFFIASIPDVNNIYQLINAMFKADNLLYGGVYQRVNPTHKIDKILDLFKKLNFYSPSIHSDEIQIEYSNFSKLLLEVKSMNLSYCYTDKRNKFENKNYFKTVEKNFKKNYNLNVKFNIIAGWKK